MPRWWKSRVCTASEKKHLSLCGWCHAQHQVLDGASSTPGAPPINSYDSAVCIPQKGHGKGSAKSDGCDVYGCNLQRGPQCTQEQNSSVFSSDASADGKGRGALRRPIVSSSATSGISNQEHQSVQRAMVLVSKKYGRDPWLPKKD